MLLEVVGIIKIQELVVVSNSFQATVVEEELLVLPTRLLANKLLSIQIPEVLHQKERAMGKEAKQITNKILEENLLEDFFLRVIKCQTIHLHNNTINLKRMFKKGVLSKQN